MVHQDSQIFEDEAPLIKFLPQLNNFRVAGRLTDLTIKTNFESTIVSDFFTQLPPDSVLSLLQADDLEVKREESVFEAVGRWMSPPGITNDTRLVHAETMLKEVRWNQIDADFRYKLFDHVGFWNRNVECSRLLGRISKWIENSSSKDDGKCPFNERKRGRLGNICVLSGSCSSAPPVLYQYDVDAKTSEKLTEVTGGLDAAFVVIEESECFGSWLSLYVTPFFRVRSLPIQSEPLCVARVSRW
ncbi:unnamed protein product [Dibothriocephalus latus]|uniref:BACK domain-containing protein n=1 Tax=Dibothriocephalus latus TaxID=60516 RepID=A0A3P7M3J8_DIBLA|nr:unnamed protein product [Dibothriocephalus latus]